MRIGMVTACYKPVVNGVTRMVSLYKERLEALGHEVTVFTLGDPDPAGEESGVIRSTAVPLGESGYYLGIRYSSEAQKLLQQMDIVHCHHLFMSVELAHRYARCPIVYTNHTRYDLYTGSISSLPQPAADALMRRVWPEFADFADVVITPSESVRRVMEAFGVRRQIELIENGVDLRPFRFPTHPHDKKALQIDEDATLLMYVGRLSAEKNLIRLVDQFRIAHDMVPTSHLYLVGGGPLEEQLRKHVKTLQLESNVHFSGVIGYEEVSNYLAAADMFVTASESEVHPLTVIEAMAAGLPVIAPSSPGIVETVESGVSGLLTNLPDGGLAAAMVGLALDSERRERMGEAALAASNQFDIEFTVEQTVKLYERLCALRPDLRRKREHGRWASTDEKRHLLKEQWSRQYRQSWIGNWLGDRFDSKSERRDVWS